MALACLMKQNFHQRKGFAKNDELVPQSIGATPAVSGAIGESLKRIENGADGVKEQAADPDTDVEDLSSNASAIHISSDDDGSDTEPHHSILNNPIGG